jgi:multicomponent K+:H+ antiporter subunit F
MIAHAVLIAFALVSIAVLLDLFRITYGPQPPDRVLALDTLSYNAIAILMLTGIHFSQDAYFAASLLIAMVGFISTVALSMYLLRGEVIE